MNCKQAKEIPIVSYLKKLGIQPISIRSNKAMFLSLFRSENTASLKVDILKNVWFDHGAGIGGNILDLVMKIHQCDLKQALCILSAKSFSFHQQQPLNKKTERTYEILKIGELKSYALIKYLQERNIKIAIAEKYCVEILYKRNSNSLLENRGNSFFTIGFKNDKDGYETRNSIFKNCLNIKAITTIRNGSSLLNIFEGFIDFLSYLSYMPDKEKEDFIITNSTAMVKSTLDILPNYQTVKTFFDNDTSGLIAAKSIKENCENDFIDESLKYKGYKDVNDYLMGYKRKG